MRAVVSIVSRIKRGRWLFIWFHRVPRQKKQRARHFVPDPLFLMMRLSTTTVGHWTHIEYQ